MKPMADGSKVVGLFNRQRNTEQMTVNFSLIGISSERQSVIFGLKQMWEPSRTLSAPLCHGTEWSSYESSKNKDETPRVVFKEVLNSV
jgi:hypothetical protein